MANGLDAGYTKIANYLLEALIASNLSKRELKLVLYIFRNGYGFDREKSEVKLTKQSSLSKDCRLHKSDIKRTLLSLQFKNIISIDRASITFNRHVDTWNVGKIPTNVGKLPTKSKQNTNFSRRVKEKRNIKINIPPISPKGDLIVSFDKFWRIYPKKVAKKSAQKKFDSIFKKLPPDKFDLLLQIIITALELQKKSDKWTRDNGRFIPHAATWLNGERWKDEIELSDAERKAREKAEALENWGLK